MLLNQQEILEYWFGIGMNLGLTEAQAIKYSEIQLQDYK